MRYTGSEWKRARRLGFSTLGNGKELVKRPYGPGQHGNGRKKKPSEYGKQLIEKQKLAQMYGVNERQFRRLFNLALKSSEVTGIAFFHILESRLDNLVYRMGFAATRRAARQMVNHGHILVNGKKVDIPSYLCKLNDVISIRESSRDIKVIKECLATATTFPTVSVDTEKLSGTFVREADRRELPLEINESFIIEYYNRLL